MKKSLSLILALFIIITTLAGCSGDNPETTDKSISNTVESTLDNDDTDSASNFTANEISDSSGKRSNRTKIVGNNEDVFTIMVYMCGTDLESDYGMATSDILEMVAADITENVNILIYTGGTREWQNSYISTSTNQIWKAEKEDIVCIEKDMGKKEMTDPATLTEFVKYCDKNYPANRNALILWDHGGGALYGYGSDEIFGGDSAMEINEINSALYNAGVSFDFIGFDACLMATVETAYMINNHADYMIASQELEPGTGWFYTNWINDICQNTSIPTTEIGKTIVNDFIQVSGENSPSDECTLSVIDLTEMDNVYNKLSEFSAVVKNDLDINKFQVVSKSRSNSKSFGGDEMDTIDIIHFAENINNDESDNLISAIQQAVVYSKNSKNINNANGLTIYFPYNNITTFNNMMNVYSDIGLKGEYTEFIKSFANLVAGGQTYNQTNDPISAIDGDWQDDDYTADFTDWDSYDWFDQDYIENYNETYEDAFHSTEDLEVVDRGDYYALELSDEDWEVINDIQVQLFWDDGEGYVDFGTDDYYELDDDYSLIVDYDGLWLDFDGIVTPFYLLESGSDYKKGYIPCLLNGEYVEIIVAFDENWDTQILGAQKYYENGMAMKGLMPIKDGDTIQLLCDYYTYEGEYDDYYLWEDEFEYDSSMYVAYSPSPSGEYLLYYVITDIYNNVYYTEPIYLTFTDEYFYENYPEYFE